MLRWLWLSLSVVALDQASKWLAEQALTAYEPLAVLPSFNLTLMYNTGAAFSFLAEAGGWQRWLFVVLAVGVSGVLVAWLYRMGPAERWTAVGVSLVLGGAVGNLIDRLLYGKVVDFIQLYYGDFYWPAFNVADSAISVGVVLLLLDNLRSKS